MTRFRGSILPSVTRAVLLLLGLGAPLSSLGAEERERPFEIRIVDRATGRGIPLVHLETVHQVGYVTDSAGRICFDEPQFEGDEIWFKVRAHGYEVPVDGFGLEGFRCRVRAGERHEVALDRRQLAERLYRVTGEDRYRDSIRLGHPTPFDRTAGEGTERSGRVAGQDSVQGVVYRDEIRWFWGDTNRLSYPLGLFHTAGATSRLPDRGGLDPTIGIALDYRTDETGFARSMIDLEAPAQVLWLDGLAVVRDGNDQERMVAHYSRRKSLVDEVEHGLLLWDDATESFRKLAERELSDSWRMPFGHPEPTAADGIAYLQFGNPFATCRVPARLESLAAVDAYESWTCLAAEAGDTPESRVPQRRADGSLDWAWRKAPPVTPVDERRWIEAGTIAADEAWYLPEDATEPGRRVRLHSGSVRWNEYRKRWVMIATEATDDPKSPSWLGEVWYSEAPSPHGPFRKALKVLGHDKQTFYNPCHHPFLDGDGGRLIRFEGTYASTFTDSPPTPRYDYNQIMYQLDLSAPRLTEVFGERERRKSP